MNNNSNIFKHRIYSLVENAVRKILNESNFNYHVSKGGPIEHFHPYASEGKAIKNSGAGHYTGDFGSGTYFVSAQSAEGRQWGDEGGEDNRTPEFINIKGSLYRVDFDIYQNMYNVPSKSVANMLYTTLKNVNAFYNMVSRGEFELRNIYQIINRNCEVLDLRCPSMVKLYRMAIEHQAPERKQSFSTLFMEYNGFNGVNVSGIWEYDNTRHGSVIYDLSKVSDKIRKVDIDYGRMPFRTSETDTVAKSNGSDAEFQDIEMQSLMQSGDFYAYLLKDVPPEKQRRILKNAAVSGKIARARDMRYLDDNVAKWYLSYLYHKADDIHDFWGNSLVVDMINNDYDFPKIIVEYNQLYWANFSHPDVDHERLFSRILDEVYWAMDYPSTRQDAVAILKNGIGRDFTPKETDIINQFLEEI